VLDCDDASRKRTTRERGERESGLVVLLDLRLDNARHTQWVSDDLGEHRNKRRQEKLRENQKKSAINSAIYLYRADLVQQNACIIYSESLQNFDCTLQATGMRFYPVLARTASTGARCMHAIYCNRCLDSVWSVFVLSACMCVVHSRELYMQNG